MGIRSAWDTDLAAQTALCALSMSRACAAGLTLRRQPSLAAPEDPSPAPLAFVGHHYVRPVRLPRSAPHSDRSCRSTAVPMPTFANATAASSHSTSDLLTRLLPRCPPEKHCPGVLGHFLPSWVASILRAGSALCRADEFLDRTRSRRCSVDLRGGCTRTWGGSCRCGRAGTRGGWGMCRTSRR